MESVIFAAKIWLGFVSNACSAPLLWFARNATTAISAMFQATFTGFTRQGRKWRSCKLGNSTQQITI